MLPERAIIGKILQIYRYFLYFCKLVNKEQEKAAEEEEEEEKGLTEYICQNSFNSLTSPIHISYIE